MKVGPRKVGTNGDNWGTSRRRGDHCLVHGFLPLRFLPFPVVSYEAMQLFVHAPVCAPDRTCHRSESRAAIGLIGMTWRLCAVAIVNSPPVVPTRASALGPCYPDGGPETRMHAKRALNKGAATRFDQWGKQGSVCSLSRDAVGTATVKLVSDCFMFASALRWFAHWTIEANPRDGEGPY